MSLLISENLACIPTAISSSILLLRMIDPQSLLRLASASISAADHVLPFRV